jgi:hypothetical protein
VGKEREERGARDGLQEKTSNIENVTIQEEGTRGEGSKINDK